MSDKIEECNFKIDKFCGISSSSGGCVGKDKCILFKTYEYINSNYNDAFEEGFRKGVIG